MKKIRISLSSWFCWSGKLRTGWQSSLSGKLTLIITGVAIVAVGGTTAISINREQQHFQAELEQQANLLLDTLNITLRDALYQLNIEVLKEVINTLGQHQELITSGYIYDERGRLLADTVSQKPIYQIEVDPVGEQLVNSATTVFEWQTDELLAGRAIAIGQQPVGAIRLGLSTAPLEHKIAHVRNRGTIVAIIAAAISAILAQWISRSITKPIKDLVQGTQQIAQGNFAGYIDLQTNDELSSLAAAFNHMSQKLQQTLLLLEQHNEELEVRVQERTQELTTTLSELQETQAQLIHSEKMSSLGQLVAGIAHEINNPVNFIHGNMDYIDEYINDILGLLALYQQHYQPPVPEIAAKTEAIDLCFLESDLIKIVKSMRIGTERIQEIVVSLRNFSRLDESDLKLANLHDGIDSSLMILQHRLKANSQRPEIQIHKNYSNLPKIACYPGQLNQVFMNLLANAIDALEESDRGFSDEDLKTHPHTISIHTQLVQSNLVVVKIRDNGPGIPETVGSKLFNPFFTTKPVGKGTGLGLSISYRIITEKHGGKLSYQSTPGQGTTFVIELPVKNL